MPSTPNPDPLKIGPYATQVVFNSAGGIGAVLFSEPLLPDSPLVDIGLTMSVEIEPGVFKRYEAAASTLAYDEFNTRQVNADWELVSPDPEEVVPLSYITGQPGRFHTANGDVRNSGLNIIGYLPIAEV